MEQQADSESSFSVYGCSNELSDELLIEIFLRLPIKSLYSVKCACKAWCNIISTNLLTEKRLKTSLSGFYLQAHKKPASQNLKLARYFCIGTDKVYRDSTMDATNLNFLPRYTNFQIVSLCNGLVLCRAMSSNNIATCFVCNPLTKTWENLPRLPNNIAYHDYHSTVAQLDFDPALSSDYRVVLVNRALQGRRCMIIPEMAIYSSDKGFWVEKKLRISYASYDHGLINFRQFVYMNGLLCSLQISSSPHFLLISCVEKGKHQCIPLPVEDAKFEILNRVNSSLYYVAYTYIDWAVHVWKLLEDCTSRELEWKIVACVQLPKDELSLCYQFSIYVEDFCPMAFYPDQDVLLIKGHGKIFAHHLNNGKLEAICSIMLAEPSLVYNMDYIDIWSSHVYPYIPCLHYLAESSN